MSCQVKYLFAALSFCIKNSRKIFKMADIPGVEYHSLGTDHKVKGGGAGKIIYLVSAISVAHPLIGARKVLAHP
jgi:hypothetical protein